MKAKPKKRMRRWSDPKFTKVSVLIRIATRDKIHKAKGQRGLSAFIESVTELAAAAL